MLSVRDRLERMIEPLPDDASVLLPVRTVREWLGAPDPDAGDLIVDLTADQVAEELGRSVGTIRDWLLRGELRGYKLRGREWRVTRAAVREFLDSEREQGNGRSTGRRQQERTDLGRWRSVRRDHGEG
jgi:excisionase family DNA binding protein